jgi:hypothetical protein
MCIVTGDGPNLCSFTSGADFFDLTSPRKKGEVNTGTPVEVASFAE